MGSYLIIVNNDLISDKKTGTGTEFQCPQFLFYLDMIIF